MLLLTYVGVNMDQKESGGVKIQREIGKIPVKNSRNIHLNHMKQQFLLNLLRKLDYDMNT